MKKTIVLITALILLGNFNANAQFGYIKKAAKKVGSTAKKVGSKTKSVTISGAKKIGGAVKSGAGYSARGARKVGGVAKTYASKGGRKVLGASKTVGSYAAKGAKKVAKSEVVRAASKVVPSIGNLVPMVIKGLTAPQRMMYEKAKKYIGKVTGKYGVFVFDLGTFVHQYAPHLSIALAENIKAVANGRNPLQVIAAPLAAALRAANTSHYKNSKPLPMSVRLALSNYFPASTLSKARYAIGKVEITLPNGINKIAKYGEGHAVTVGNVIVFSKDPGAFSDSPLWWAHEVAHVDQYAKQGMEKFAYNYMKDLGKSIERDADRTARRIVNQIYNN